MTPAYTAPLTHNLDLTEGLAMTDNCVEESIRDNRVARAMIRLNRYKRERERITAHYDGLIARELALIEDIAASDAPLS